MGISAPLVRLGLAGDGSLEPPRSAEAIGWFTGSAAPGDVGPAVIAGHVTWGSTPGAFLELATLTRGDRVVVRREDGVTARFAVTQVLQFSKDRFPTRAVYGMTDHAALRLITCGGRFDSTTGRYRDNVVVFARLVPGRDRTG